MTEFANLLETAANPETPTPARLLANAITAAGDAAYHWAIASDALTWSANAALILNRNPEVLDSGKKFANLLDTDNLTTRFDAVVHSLALPDPAGVAFRIEYQLRASADGPAIWVEDSGCWYPDAEGKPREVYGVVHLITDRHERDQHLSVLSHSDKLTGMMNRGRLTEALEEAISVTGSGGADCAFAVAAVNNLDVINDAFGFDVADEVIATVAKRLRSVMRGGDGIGRYSGSKFGIILNSCNRAELDRALERFLLVVRDGVIETRHGPVWAMLSIGAAAIPESADSADRAMTRAEESLSRALRQSTDSQVVFEHSQERETQRMVNARCATEIIECLKNGVFHLAFQPLVNVVTGKADIHEGLLRMKDTAGEFVAAGHLVPVAERLGLIRLIDRAVVQLALETLHRHPAARIAINISATTANDARWNRQIIDMIASAQPLNERLIVEITETTALSDLKIAIAFFEKLRAAGCCVAIDDFGAGFTSFRNLRDLPVDIIKLDGSYCRNLASDGENAYFAKTLIDMARRFSLKTVAEWVETAEDAEALKAMGIDYLQGNFMGAPDMVAPWEAEETSAFTFVGAEPAVAAHQEVTANDQAPEEIALPEIPERTNVSDPQPLLNPEAIELPHDATSDEAEDAPFHDAAEESLTRLKEALADLTRSFAPLPQEEESDFRLAG